MRSGSLRTTRIHLASEIKPTNQYETWTPAYSRSLAHETMALMSGASEQEIIEAKEVIELFASFNAIADSLRIPCDVTHEMVKQKH